MDPATIIKLAEELIYRVAMWFVLVPKTLYTVTAHPAWIPGYVADELAKPKEVQFDAYMPPLLFLLIVAVLPNILFNNLFPGIPYSDFLTSRGMVTQAASLKPDSHFLLFGVFWTLLPLSFAIVHQRHASREVTHSALKPVFYTQCLRVAPLSVVLIARFLLVLATSPPGDVARAIDLTSVVLMLLWVVYSDLAVSHEELKVSRAKGLKIVLQSVGLYYLMVAPVMLVSHLAA